MHNVLNYLRQAPAYLAFALVVGYFATLPPYQYSDPDTAIIKLSLSHAAEHVEPCVQLTPEQIAEFAANMRHTESCERQRLPLILEMDIDGQRAFNLVAEPTGVWGDGPASIYERFDIPAGSHSITVRLRDTDRSEGWDYTGATDVVLEPGRYFTVTFRATTGGFKFR